MIFTVPTIGGSIVSHRNIGVGGLCLIA